MSHEFRFALFFAVACGAPSKEILTIPTVEPLSFTELQLEEVCSDCELVDAPQTSAGDQLSSDVKRAMFAAYMNGHRDWVCPAADLTSVPGMVVVSEADELCGLVCTQANAIEVDVKSFDTSDSRYRYWMRLHFEHLAFVHFNESDAVIVSCGSGVGGVTINDVLAFRRGGKLVLVKYQPRLNDKKAKQVRDNS